MYELLIKKHGTETFVTADLGTEKPALNFKRNDIGELKNRKADYSQSLVLPMTPTNCQIFGHVQGDQVLSEIPYRKHEIRLFYNRLEMFGVGSYLILNNTVGGFAVQLLSGVADLFDRMQMPDSMAGLCGYVKQNGAESFMDGTGFNQNGVIYPVATFTTDTIKSIDTGPQYRIPSASVKHILNKITEGYTLKHNIPETDLEKMGLSCVDKIENVTDRNLLNAHAEKTFNLADQWRADFQTSDITKRAIGNLTATGRTNPAGDTYISQFIYVCRFSGTAVLDFELLVNWDPREDTIVQNVKIINSTKGTYHNEEISGWSADFYCQQYPITVDVGDVITVEFVTGYNSSYASGHYWLDISQIETTDVGPIETAYDVSFNLGFKTQFEFFKSLIQTFGATISVQEDKKIIEMYTFDKVVENKQYHRDWTNKYVGQIASTYVLPNYAQENNITKKDNATDSFIDSGTFAIDNTTLQKQKELFPLPFEAARDYSVRIINRPTGGPLLINPNVTVTSVPMITKEESTSGEIKYKFTKRPPHLVTIEPVTLEYDTGSIPTYKALDIPGQEIVDTYYFALINSLLKNTKVIRAFFWLDENDIDQYRQTDPDADCTGTFIPVFLKQYGKYFYINSINNFIGSGQPTEVELIKI